MKKIIINLSIMLSVIYLFILSACAPSAPQSNRYTVTFKDYDGTVLKNEIVEESKNATAPQDPIRYGYIFLEFLFYMGSLQVEWRGWLILF